MKILATIWQKFKSEPDVWFFYAFLLTFTLSIRKIIYFYPIKGDFNEYSAISLYLSDIFLFLTLIVWVLSILCNKYTILSMYNSTVHSLYSKKVWITCWEWLNCSTPARNKNVPRGTFLGGWNTFNNRLFIILLFLVFWAFLSIIWSDNKIVAFYRSMKLLEFLFLYIYVIHKIFRARPINCSTWNNIYVQLRNVPRGTFLPVWNILKTSGFIIVTIGLFQSFVGIWQFIAQKSIGLIWLKESIISPETLGVAKLVIGSEIYIRAYGLFPHPNMLGGFLLVSIILTILFQKMYRACPAECSTPARNINVPCGTLMGGWNNFTGLKQFHRGGTIWWILLSIQVLALILTFSKSSIIGLFIAFIYIFINRLNNVPRGTFRDNKKMFHVEHIRKYFIISLLLFGFLLFYFRIDLYSLFIQSLEERLVYLAISIKAISSHLLLGLGNGQFVMEMQIYAASSLEFWQYQPVHNVFLLILSELGIIGLFLFVWFLLELFAKVPCVPRGMLHHVKSSNVPRGTFEDNVVNVEHSLRSGTVGRISVEQLEKQNRESILQNNIHNLSSNIISTYFKAILLGFIFIMLFDHYLWDIQQGQIMLWTILGFSVSLHELNNQSGQ